jgi:hypothetical protein
MYSLIILIIIKFIKEECFFLFSQKRNIFYLSFLFSLIILIKFLLLKSVKTEHFNITIQSNINENK